MRLRRFPILPFLVVILFIGCISVSILYLKTIYSGQKKPEIDPAVLAISRFMDLPSDTPTVTVITNLEAAQNRDPVFFQKAALNDKLIAYQNLLILFDPKTNRVKNIETFAAPPKPPEQPITVSIRYNGKSEARAKALIPELSKFSNNIVITETVASQAIYPADVVYEINKARKTDIINLAQALGGSPIKPTPEPADAGVQADLIIAFSDMNSQ